jgi:hypothetical protein
MLQPWGSNNKKDTSQSLIKNDTFHCLFSLSIIIVTAWK